VCILQYTTMIPEDNKKQLERFKYMPPHPSYIAGFIDGDGSIFIRKITDGYQSGFLLTQCRTNILQIIRYHFGGSITSSSNRNNKTINLMDETNEYYHKHNIRNQFNLLIRNNEYQILLDYLQNYFIIKENQYQYLRQFSKLANLQNQNEEKEKLYLKCSEVNKKCNLDESYLIRLNNQYIAGLFDAEGCIYIDKINSNYFISIAQKNHTKILDEIVKFLGFGKVETYDFKIYKRCDCLQFIQLVKPYLIVKYNQAEAFETFLKTNDTKIKEQMYAICNKEKHEIEIFNDLNKNEHGKEGYLENMRIRFLKEQICKEIHLKQVYREKSEKMKGEGNHNFGKSFSEETKKKMSISIRDIKGGVTDKIIIEVRNFIAEGYKNIEIQEKLNLPRHTVTRIKNGEIVCRNEEKKEKHPLTQIEINLSKRKIKTDEIIIVIEKLNEKWKPMQILDYLIEERNKNNILNQLTIDIIKNIKRNLTNKKHVIYESELPKERYEYYTQLLKEFV
jgi:hypothetical protein